MSTARDTGASAPSLAKQTSLAQLSRFKRPKHRVILPRDVIFKVLDESCVTTARLQREPRWSAHLASR